MNYVEIMVVAGVIALAAGAARLKKYLRKGG